MKNEQEIRNALIAKVSEDAEFRAQLLENPHAAVEAGVGITIPSSISLTVHEESPTSLHLVVPSAGNLSKPEMEAVAGGHFHMLSDW